MTSAISNVALLGVCERAQLVDSAFSVPAWNIIGLKQYIPSYIFPAGLSTLKLVFAVHDPVNTAVMFNVKGPDGKDIGWYSFAFNEASDGGTQRPVSDMCRSTFFSTASEWATVVFPIEAGKLFFPAPGFYEFVVKGHDGPLSAGGIHLIQVEAPPLTLDRIAAVKADPDSAKLIRLEFKCSGCGDAIAAYAALERDSELDSSGCLWYEEVPSRFQCGCGKQNVDISSVRRNLHALLGTTTGPAAIDTSFIPRYERTALESLRVNFIRLLESDPPEEAVQQFLEGNPVLLHTFSPRQLFFKKPILASFRTDFVAVNHASELLLIEIEKPSTRLLTKSGGLSAELQHAFDQVRSWLHVVDEHRLAALEAIGVNRSEVASIVGVVIAGRDAPYDRERLRWLKSIDHGRVRLLTYDDLHVSLGSLVRSVERL